MGKQPDLRHDSLGFNHPTAQRRGATGKMSTPPPKSFPRCMKLLCAGAPICCHRGAIVFW